MSGCNFVPDKEINSAVDAVRTGAKWYVNKPVHFVSSVVAAFPTCTMKVGSRKKSPLA